MLSLSLVIAVDHYSSKGDSQISLHLVTQHTQRLHGGRLLRRTIRKIDNRRTQRASRHISIELQKLPLIPIKQGRENEDLGCASLGRWCTNQETHSVPVVGRRPWVGARGLRVVAKAECGIASSESSHPVLVFLVGDPTIIAFSPSKSLPSLFCCFGAPDTEHDGERCPEFGHDNTDEGLSAPEEFRV